MANAKEEEQKDKIRKVLLDSSGSDLQSTT